MNFTNLPPLAMTVVFIIGCFLVPLNCSAQEQHSWKDTNDEAIRAMRDTMYDQSERLFKQALTECSDQDGKSVIQENFDVLLDKEGRKKDAGIDINFDSKPTANPALQKLDMPLADPAKTMLPQDLLNQLDAEIKKADASGNLELLQSLFQRKLEALQTRDGGESLEYAYCLHFRAQVLQHLHRDDESKALEERATKLRDQLRIAEPKAKAAATKIPPGQNTPSIRPLTSPGKSTYRPQ